MDVGYAYEDDEYEEGTPNLAINDAEYNEGGDDDYAMAGKKDDGSGAITGAGDFDDSEHAKNMTGSAVEVTGQSQGADGENGGKGSTYTKTEEAIKNPKTGKKIGTSTTKQRSQGTGDAPVTFTDLVLMWGFAVKHPATKDLCARANNATLTAIGSATGGFGYLVTIFKPGLMGESYLTNTIGALLEILEDPFTDAMTFGIVRKAFEIILGLQPLQKILMLIRNIIMPFMKLTQGMGKKK